MLLKDRAGVNAEALWKPELRRRKMSTRGEKNVDKEPSRERATVLEERKKLGGRGLRDKGRERHSRFTALLPPLAQSEFIARVISIHKR